MAMRSVPPRGSGWVVHGAAMTRVDLLLPNDLVLGADPPATARWY
jgi:hypothetical protein